MDRRDFFAPHLGGIFDLHLVVKDRDVDGRTGLPFENDPVETGESQFVDKVAAALRSNDTHCLGRFEHKVRLAANKINVRTGEDEQERIGAERVHFPPIRSIRVQQHLAAHCATADKVSRQFRVEVYVLDAL
jgi:hypothetical protein